MKCRNMGCIPQPSQPPTDHSNCRCLGPLVLSTIHRVRRADLARAAQYKPAGLGFRVKSGWAMAVLLAGPSQSPQIVKCGPILLSDPHVSRSRQPYHAALPHAIERRDAITQELVSVVRAAAEKSVRELLEEAAAAGYEVRRAALVVGSLVDPATLHNDHMKAHGFEGQLFRTVLEDAFRARGISCATLVEKSAYEEASEALRLTPAKAKNSVAKWGEMREGSWRAEEKLAALGAWMALAARGKKSG